MYKIFVIIVGCVVITTKTLWDIVIRFFTCGLFYYLFISLYITTCSHNTQKSIWVLSLCRLVYFFGLIENFRSNTVLTIYSKAPLPLSETWCRLNTKTKEVSVISVYVVDFSSTPSRCRRTIYITRWVYTDETKGYWDLKMSSLRNNGILSFGRESPFVLSLDNLTVHLMVNSKTREVRLSTCLFFPIFSQQPILTETCSSTLS